MGARRYGRPPAEVRIPLQDLTDVGGRLQSRYRQWRHLADRTVRDWIRHGFRLDFADGAPPSGPFPAPFDSALRLLQDKERYSACDDTVMNYLKKRILEIVPDGERGEGLYQTFFPVPKKTSGEWRGCLDARPVNDDLRYEKFKMEGLHTVRESLRRDDWLMSIDRRVADAYPHLLIPRRCTSCF